MPREVWYPRKDARAVGASMTSPPTAPPRKDDSRLSRKEDGQTLDVLKGARNTSSAVKRLRAGFHHEALVSCTNWAKAARASDRGIVQVIIGATKCPYFLRNAGAHESLTTKLSSRSTDNVWSTKPSKTARSTVEGNLATGRIVWPATTATTWLLTASEESA